MLALLLLIVECLTIRRIEIPVDVMALVLCPLLELGIGVGDAYLLHWIGESARYEDSMRILTFLGVGDGRVRRPVNEGYPLGKRRDVGSTQIEYLLYGGAFS